MQGNFIGLTRELSTIRLGFIYTDNDGKTFSHNKFFGSSSSTVQFKTASTFIEKSVSLDDLKFNIGISYDKIFIDPFKEKGNFFDLHFHSLNTLSQNVFIDMHYPFKILGFSGSLNLGSSKRKFSSPFNLRSEENFEFPSKNGKRYFDGELNLVKGPFFLSVNYLEDKSPIFNIGFKIRPY